MLSEGILLLLVHSQHSLPHRYVVQVITHQLLLLPRGGRPRRCLTPCCSRSVRQCPSSSSSPGVPSSATGAALPVLLLSLLLLHSTRVVSRRRKGRVRIRQLHRGDRRRLLREHPLELRLLLLLLLLLHTAERILQAKAYPLQQKTARVFPFDNLLFLVFGASLS